MQHTVLLCPRCHSTRLVSLTYNRPEPGVDGHWELPAERPAIKCVHCGTTLHARDVLVQMQPRHD